MTADLKKPWLLPALNFFLADRELEKSEFKLLARFLLDSDGNGDIWKGRERLEAETALSKRTLADSAKGLIAKSLVTRRVVRTGEPLPSGWPAARDRYVYRLTEKVTGILAIREAATPIAAIPIASIRETAALPPGQRSPSSGSAVAALLRDQDQERKIERTDRAREPVVASREHPREALNKLSLRIRNNEPLDPTRFRVAVNEAIEDGIAIPEDVSGAIARLRKNARLETTGIGKIEWTGWNEPTNLRELLAIPSPPPDENLEAVIARAMAAMKK